MIAAFALAAFLLGNLLDGPGATTTVAADELPVAAVVPASQAKPESAPRPRRDADARLTAKLRALVDSSIETAKRESRGVATRENTFISVHVQELGTDGALVSIGSARSVRPASNMKLATSAAALVTLGGSWNFETRFEAGGPVENGVLRGDLIVRAGGDPLYDHTQHGDVSHLLAPVARELVAHGITRVAGDVVLDEGTFLEPGPGPSWPDASQYWEDYCALAAGFTANGGCVSALVTPTGSGREALRRVRPQHLDLPLRGRVMTGWPKSRLDVRVGATTAAVTVTGSIPEGLDARDYRFSHPDPVGLFGACLLGALQDGGVRVDGAVVRRRGAPAGEPVAVLSSPLLPLLTPINTESDNAIADQVFFALGKAITGEGTREGGARAVGAALERLGLETEGWVQVDGSGLSRDNRITARQLTALLDAVLTLEPQIAQAYVASLAVAGRTGTLDDRMRGTSAENRVRAKTGWIRGTSALSGVVETTGGRLLVFSILVDYPAQAGGLNTSVFKPLQDSICVEIVDWQDGVR
ncbi:MAG: D-alanyl-D-alanine carboxypeptidase/D-alanyl-D-alanine-endopeptidase [Planctomycetes bacterium]|nr:D-alanyl-D-alanine carboxypeptidase/D-alanyl-D-alanine-endopeptidase [Planctomycetota bacterium]MCB9904032.1 D-alanyl-D-alanine carboxypeptidase/D-alanyl-D-alanine-endopeptidase [Planctomycetota bacterium]